MILKKGSKGGEVRELQAILGIAQDGIFGVYTEKAVKEFQLRHGLDADGIVGTRTWDALHADAGNISPTIRKSKRRITEIFVHCTATPEGKDYSVADIRRWHLKKGWSDIGYHYVIYRDGSIHEGRDIDKAGAHVVGHNRYSVGVVYIGGVDSLMRAKDTRTPAQKESLLALLRELRKLYPTAKIYGHRDFANKACPSFDAKTEYKDI